MFKSYFSYSILRKIINTLFFAIVLTVAIISFLFSTLLSTNLTKESYASFEKVINGVASTSDMFYEEVISILSQLTFNDADIKSIMFQNEHSRLVEYSGIQTMRDIKATYPYIEYLAVYNQKMNNLISTVTFDKITDQKLKDIVNTNYNQKGISVISTPVSFVTSRVSFEEINTVTIIMYSPFSKPDQKGVVVLGINCEYFQKLFGKIDTGNLDSIIVLDKNNLLIGHPDDSLLLQDYSNRQFVQRISSSTQKSGYFIDNIDHLKMLLNYTKSYKSGWTFVSITPYEKAFIKLNAMHRTIIIIAIVILNIGIIISYLIAIKIFKPFKWLLKKFNYNPEGGLLHDSNECIFLDNEFQKLNLNSQLSEPLIRSMTIQNLLKLQSAFNEYINPNKIDEMFKSPFYIAILLTIDNKEVFNAKSVEEQSYIRNILCNLASEMLEKNYTTLDTVFVNSSTAVAILHLSDGRQPNGLNHSLIQLLKNMHKTYQQSISAAVSSVVNSIYAINDAYEEVTVLMKEQFFRGFGALIANNELKKREYIDYPKELESSLLYAIKNFDQDEINSIVYKLDSILKNVTYEYAITYVTRNVTYILSHSLKNLPDIDTHTFHKFIWDLYNTETLDIVMNKLKKTCMEIAAYYKPKEIEASKPFVERAIELAHLKYADPSFSINTAAIDLDISTAYFNRVFKKEKGLSYSEFLSYVRLEKAKELLKHTDESVSNICIRVGITNNSYFYTLFKKMYHVAPQKYRYDLDKN